MSEKLIIINIIVICFIFSCQKKEAISYQVENGKIDISEYSFSNGSVSLKGDWKFKWLEDDKEYISTNYNDDNWDTLKVPGYWNNKVKKSYGYCWLRVKIRNNPAENLGLYLMNANTAYKLYVNENLVMQNGNPGDSKAESRAQTFPLYINLPKTQFITISWKISNYDINNGGPIYAPVIDSLNKTIYFFWFNKLKDAIVIGFILMIAVYNLIIWFCRKEEKASLYLSIFCFIVCARFLITTRIFESIFYFINLYGYIKKIEYLTMTLAPLLFLIIVRNLFDKCFNRNIYDILKLIQIVISLFILVTPLYIYSKLLLLYQILIVIYCLYIIGITIWLVINKTNDSILFLLGFIILFVAALNDIFINIFVLYNVSLLQIGVIIFIIIPTILLNIRLARAYKTAEYLSSNLKREVENQTKEINHLMQQKTALFINLAHETKTPLTLIRNYLDKYLETHPQDADLLVIKSNIDKLTRDMVNFLDAEKIEQQRLIYDPSAVIDFSGLLEEKIKLFQTLADKKQITLTSSIEPEISILSDPYGLDRIINNLLDNAIRYTPENGKVIVILKRPEPEQIQFRVEDTGRGIPATQQQHIFNKYYQISGEKQNIQGMGMGLFITKSIVEQLDSRISFISQENKGTSFTVLFKTLSQPGKETEKKDFIPSRPIDSLSHMVDSALIAYNINKYSILIVEDNIDLLHALRQSLAENYNVYTAINGREALNFMEKDNSVDIIITDIMMDVMDGYAFYHELQKEEKWRSIPLIFLTARTTQQEKMTGLKAGAVDYIFKPFYMEELIYKIQSILKIQTLQKILIEKQKYMELGKLVAGIAHQILNPLTSIDVPLQLIERDLVTDDQTIYEYVKSIKVSTDRIKGLVKSLKHLNYNSADMNEEVVLRDILDSVITLIPRDIKGRIDFQINIEKDYIVKGNTAAFNHIFLNLISNAVDAITGKGEIRFEIVKHEHDLAVSVADTGTGISEEDLPKIFDMDFTTKSVGKGTGLGLYMVRNLVKRMGWEIQVESRAGAGTIFYLLKKEYDY